MAAMRIPRQLISLLPLLLLLTACGDGGTSTPPPATQQTLTPGPRLVSTVPAATLMLVQMGADDRLVGVSTYDKAVLPEERQDLPVVGDYLTLNFEQLLRLRPTAIIVQSAEDRLSPRLKEYAAANNVQILNVRLDTLADMATTAEALGKAAGVPDIARQKADAAQAKLAAIRTAVKDKPRPKVLYIIGKEPIFIAGGNRFLDEIITAAGGQNLGATVGKDFPTITREKLITLAPDVILISAPGEPPSNDPSDPRIARWASLPTPAARTGRIHLMTDPDLELNALNAADSALQLAQILHPDLKTWAPPETPDTAPATSPGAHP